MKRVLFIDRDGTLVVEPPVDKQVDSLEKLEFVPKVFQSLAYVATRLDFEWVMVTNPDSRFFSFAHLWYEGDEVFVSGREFLDGAA